MKKQKHRGLKNINVKGSMFLDFKFFISKLRFVFFDTGNKMKKSEIMEFGLKTDVKGAFLSFKKHSMAFVRHIYAAKIYTKA